MRITGFKSAGALLLLMAALLATWSSAEKPEWAGAGKHGKAKQLEKQDPAGSPQGKPERAGGHFGDAQRAVVRDYYNQQYRAGRCPPGLAKKNNGCMPPGQARKWVIGQPLPREVVYYSLPPAIVVQLGVPPVGHRYVRVASDILLIAIGTGLVIDAIQDLGRQ